MRQKISIRSFPDPDDNKKDIKFKGDQDYLEFIIKALNHCSEKEWYWFKHLLNPNFKNSGG